MITEEAVGIAARELARRIEPKYVTPADPETAEIVLGVSLLVILHHLAFGFPLEMPASVLEGFREWMKAGYPGDKGQCERCGYLHPPAFTTCALCGSRVGQGLYSKRQARAAAGN